MMNRHQHIKIIQYKREEYSINKKQFIFLFNTFSVQILITMIENQLIIYLQMVLDHQYQQNHQLIIPINVSHKMLIHYVEHYP
jgi:hypothetical protein